MRESLSASTSLPIRPPLSGVGSSGQMCPMRFQSESCGAPSSRPRREDRYSEPLVEKKSLGRLLNHSVASGKEADDHAIRKFMKDVERRCERHTEIMPLVGEFMKDAINKMKKE